MSSLALNLRRQTFDGGDPNFRLDVGSVLGRTFEVWTRNLGPFCVVGLIVESPVLLGLAAIALSGSSMPILQRLLELTSNVLALILTGAVTFGVFRHLEGERAGLGEILHLGFSRLGTVWGTAILTGLATALGFCALIIPGLILMARFWVSVPVAVIEQPGASAAMGRSGELTAGNRWRVFAVAMVLGAVLVASTLAFGLLLGLLSTSIPTTGTGAAQPAWQQGLLELFVLPILALNATGPAIVYHDLRVGKEGADVEELIRVFA